MKKKTKSAQILEFPKAPYDCQCRDCCFFREKNKDMWEAMRNWLMDRDVKSKPPIK